MSWQSAVSGRETGKRAGHVRKLDYDLHEVLHFIYIYIPTHIPKLSAFGYGFQILIPYFSYHLNILDKQQFDWKSLTIYR